MLKCERKQGLYVFQKSPQNKRKAVTLEFWFILWIPGQYWFSQQTNRAHPGLRPPQPEPLAAWMASSFLRTPDLSHTLIPFGEALEIIRPQLLGEEAKKLRKQRKEKKGK